MRKRMFADETEHVITICDLASLGRVASSF